MARLLSAEIVCKFDAMFGGRLQLSPVISLEAARSTAKNTRLAEADAIEISKGISLAEVPSSNLDVLWTEEVRTRLIGGYFLLDSYAECGLFRTEAAIEKRDLLRLLEFDMGSVFFYDAKLRKIFALDYDADRMAVTYSRAIAQS